MFGLEGKAALITGAAQGIGYGIACALAGHGAKLALADINQDELERFFQQEPQFKDSAIKLRMDVSNATDVVNGVDRVMNEFGSLDILVNNAGIVKDALVMRMKEEDWDRVLDVNLKGAFLCARAAARAMIKSRWGRIINIASVVGQMGNPGQANYSAAKAGLIGLTKTLAKELAPRGITANAITPGYIETSMTARLEKNIKDEMLKIIPLKRFGSIEDIAFMVTVLASEQAGYITGQVIPVNGGMYM
ncbi:3-oxoacyl-[acyl-carrier-protein] reductase [bacterium]|nr:3-oxoacyl-[acyl-carrier-protein] reductase [bacterium]